MSDPAAVEGTDDEKRKAFADAFMVLKRRIDLFAALPVEKLDALTIKRHMDEIGQTSL